MKGQVRIVHPGQSTVELLEIVSYLNEGHAIKDASTKWQLTCSAIETALWRTGYRRRSIWEIPAEGERP